MAERRKREPPPPGEADLIPEMAERALLGVWLVPFANALDGVAEPEHFYTARHQQIAAAVLAQRRSGEHVDVLLVGDRLRRDGLLDVVGGMEYLHELMTGGGYGPPSTNVAQHAALVRDRARQRQLVDKGHLLSAAALRGDAREIATLVAEIQAAHAPAAGGGLPEPVDWHELFASDQTTEDWLVEGLWPRGRMISITAGRKERKSLLMLYLVACLAAGRCPWTGRSVRPVRVIYLDHEMTEADVHERLHDMGFKPDELSNLAYFLHPVMPTLDRADGGQMLLVLIRAHDAEAVVIDTFSRVIVTPDYSGHDVREFYRHTGHLVKAEGVALARLDHTGHADDSRAKGSADKGGDIDVGWALHRRDGGAIRLEHHGLNRIRWVPDHLDLVPTDDPVAFRRAVRTWTDNAKECAIDLDLLGVPIDTTGNDAIKALKEAGIGRQRKVVLDAVAFRREAQ